jgi:hypothetical protein
MAMEFKAKRFFSDDTIGQFYDPYRYCQIAIEYFISQVLYAGEWARVCFATDDICYRRRVELLGQGKINNGQSVPFAQSLGLPFSNYNQTEEWDNDDRFAAIQAGQFVLGMYDSDFDATIRCAAVKSKWSVTSHFGRRDDLRLAAQLAYWERYLKYPFYFNSYVTFGKTRLCIPTNITIESVSSNLDYKEGDWLNKSKIFPMKIEMTARSYEVLLRTVQTTEFEGVTTVPITFRNHHDETPDYMTTRPLVETTLLHFGIQKFGFDKPATTIKKAYRAKSIDLMNAGQGYSVDDELFRLINGFRVATVKVTKIDEGGAITGYICTRAASYEDFSSTIPVIEEDGTSYLADQFTGGSGTGAEFRVRTESFIPDPDVEIYTPHTFTKPVVDIGIIDINTEDYGSTNPLKKEVGEGLWQRDILEGYFSNVKQLVFKSFGIDNPPKGTLVDINTGRGSEDGIAFDPCTMHRINYEINVVNDPFHHLEIIVDSRVPYIIERPEDMQLNSTIKGSVLIKGLFSDSVYDIKLIAFYESGESVLANLGPYVTRTAKDITPVFKNETTGQLIKTEDKESLPEGFAQLPQGVVGATESEDLVDFSGKTLNDADTSKNIVNEVIEIESKQPVEIKEPSVVITTKEDLTEEEQKKSGTWIPGKGKDPLVGFSWD